MNWLAHLYLSEPSPASRIGNLLPDLVPAWTLKSLSVEFHRGIAEHLYIDAFTDSHPVFRRSIQRFNPPFRRYGGILCDVFYDHFLARNWASYSTEPLPDFTHGIYATFDEYRASIPPDAYLRLNQMKTDDWLCSYRDLSGVSQALARIGLRLRRPVALAESVAILEKNYDAFLFDFREFFPQLQSHASAFEFNAK